MPILPQFSCWALSPATKLHLFASSADSCSAKFPLIVVDPLGSSCSTIRALSDVNGAQAGDRASLKVFGFPARTKETQYAISSCANVISAGAMGWKVVVPFILKKESGKRSGTTSQV